MSSGKLRYGVIGIQGVGRHHLRFARAHPLVELVALVDVDEGAVRRQAAELGVRAFSDHRALLDAGLVDAVSIATPHHCLAPIGLDCLAADLHILVEKPFATTISEARAMNRLAAQRGRQIGVAFQYRTHAAARRLHGIVASGVLGTIEQAVWRWAEFRPDAYYHHSPWRASWRESGGGVLMNQVSHDLDLLCWLLGPPVGVSARIANRLHQTDLEDTVTATIEFQQGVQVAFQATINQPRAFNCRFIAGDRGLVALPGDLGRPSDRDEVRMGLFDLPTYRAVRDLPGGHDQPAIRWQFSRRRAFRRSLRWLRRLPGVGRLASWRSRLRPAAPTGHEAIFDRFVRAALGQGEPLVTGQDAQHVVELMNGMVLSSLQDRWVTFPLDEQAYDQCFETLCLGERRVPRWR